MSRTPINRSPLIPQQQAVVNKRKAKDQVLDRVNELLGESVDPDTLEALDQINTEFQTP